MGPYLRLSLVLEILLVGTTMHLVATGRHPRRLLGVHLGREKNDADRRLARQVRGANALLVLSAIAAVLIAEEALAIYVMLALSFLSPAVVTWGYFAVVKRIDRPQISRRYAVPIDRISTRALVSLPLELANVMIMVGTSVAYATLSSRSPSQLWFILLMMIFYSGMPWLGAWIASRERTALPPAAIEETSRLQLARKGLSVRMLEWIVIGMNAGSSFCWIGLATAGEQMAGAVVLGTIVIASLATIGPLAFHMPAMLEINDRLRELGADELGTRKDAWRLGGMIYYAPDDPALFVPKTSSVGSTMNFARPGAWFFIAGIVLVPTTLALLVVFAAA
jgi:uncharacterized membrane protein